MIISTTLVITCTKTHFYSKVTRPYLRVLVLTTQYTTIIQIKIYFDDSTKGLIAMAKCKGRSNVATRLKSRSSRKLQQ